MKWWGYRAEKAAYLRTAKTWVFAKPRSCSNYVEPTKKEVLLNDRMPDVRRRDLLTRTFGAPDHRPAKIVISSMLGVDDRVSVNGIGVGERQTVRAPFGYQHEQKGHRESATPVPHPHRLTVRFLHDSVSLTISFYGGNLEGFSDLSFHP